MHVSRRQLIALVLFAAVLRSSSGSVEAQAPRSPEIVITNVTVIDATGAPAKPGMTVAIRGDRISDITRFNSATRYNGVTLIDGTGKFLIPGLWDMHAHNSYRSFLALFVANGVIGLRDMGGSPKEAGELRQWRQELEREGAPLPRVVAAGIVVDGPADKGRPDSLNVTNASEARAAVIQLKQSGVDFIKVYSLLPREAYFEIGREAKRQGLPFAGHVPADVTAAEASDAGQKSMEHFFGVLPACSKIERELMAESRAEIASSKTSVFLRPELRGQVKAMDNWDSARAAELFKRFVRNGTWQVPTLVGYRNLANADDNSLETDPRARYVPRERRASWSRQRSYMRQLIPAEYWADSKRLLEKQKYLTGAMQKAGVGLMAGTDTAGFYVYPGFSLHDELEMFVLSGLTPMQALQTATRNPAIYLGRIKDAGTIARGKLADLVLLEANPLQSIRNTKKIWTVVLGGKVFSRGDLDRILAGAEVRDDQK